MRMGFSVNESQMFRQGVGGSAPLGPPFFQLFVAAGILAFCSPTAKEGVWVLVSRASCVLGDSFFLFFCLYAWLFLDGVALWSFVRFGFRFGGYGWSCCSVCLFFGVCVRGFVWRFFLSLSPSGCEIKLFSGRWMLWMDVSEGWLWLKNFGGLVGSGPREGILQLRLRGGENMFIFGFGCLGFVRRRPPPPSR